MKNMTKGLIASMLMLPAAAFAGGPSELSYTYVQGGYTSLTTDSDVDADGWYAGGSFLVLPNVFVFGSYSDTSSEDFTGPLGAVTFNIDATSYNAGLGLRAPVTDFMDINVGAAWVHAESDTNASTGGSSSTSDDGYSISAGVRSLLGKALEVNAGYNYVDLDDSQGSFDVGGLVHITSLISVSAAYRFGEDANAWTAGARLNF